LGSGRRVIVKTGRSVEIGEAGIDDVAVVALLARAMDALACQAKLGTIAVGEELLATKFACRLGRGAHLLVSRLRFVGRYGGDLAAFVDLDARDGAADQLRDLLQKVVTGGAIG
jgi:hypothetical protein